MKFLERLSMEIYHRTYAPIMLLHMTNDFPNMRAVFIFQKRSSENLSGEFSGAKVSEFPGLFTSSSAPESTAAGQTCFREKKKRTHVLVPESLG